MNEFSLKWAIDMYQLMQMRGVVLYGAGKEGALAVETLEREGIRVNAVADQCVGKTAGNRVSISVEELCAKGKNEVCIVTPLQKIRGRVFWELEQNFEVVIDNFIVHWIAYFFPHDIGELRYMSCFPFNHYESPYSQQNELNIYRECKKNEDALLDLNINIENQLEFCPKLLHYASDFLEKKEKSDFRYREDNSYFRLGDAFVLHSMMREYHSQRVIEIGSGFSTCVMLDTREYWEDCSDMKIMCIEPYPERLYANIRSTDEISIKRSFVQNVDFKEFEDMNENDILFIDSSHVTRTGGDIPYEYFQILPRLKPGVLIHIHDIFYPFAYSEKWILEGRAYNEAYLLRALLMNSHAYEIIFWNDLMREKYSCHIPESNPVRNVFGGGSLWLRKR